MNADLQTVLNELSITKNELLEQVDITARERVNMYARSIATKDVREKYLSEHKNDKGFTRMTLYNILFKGVSTSEYNASLILEVINSVSRKKQMNRVYTIDDIGLNISGFGRKSDSFIRPMIICSRCGYNFQSHSVFNKHYTRCASCLSKEEMYKRGWECKDQSVSIVLNGVLSVSRISTWSIPMDDKAKERLRRKRSSQT